MLKSWPMPLVLLCLLVIMQGGCATVDKRIMFPYQPTVQAKGGSGTVILAASGNPAKNPPASVLWVVGSIQDSQGQKIANVVSDTAIQEEIQKAFKAELTQAGYTVSLVGTLPPKVKKGLDLTKMDIKLIQKNALGRVDCDVEVKVHLEIWKNGNVVKANDYRGSESNVNIQDKDTALQATLIRTMHVVMKSAIPDIIKTLE